MLRKVLTSGAVSALLGSLLVGAIAFGTAQPANAASFTDWTEVSAGDHHVCGIRAGNLYCWGNDGFGQLGNGATATDQHTPVLIAGRVDDWDTVSTGSGHTCAIRSGRLYCWGGDHSGQLGNGPNVANRFSPSLVGAESDWTSVSAGGDHTCAIRSARGLLYCWGYNHNGQVGNGSAGGDQHTPVLISQRTEWTSVSAGSSHTCAVRDPGVLFCWGEGAYGKLGNGLTIDRTNPVIVGNAADWKSVSAGVYHTCAVGLSGRLACWGDDTLGQLGNGTGTGIRKWPEPISGSSDWTAVSAGWHQTCALRDAGFLYCWGSDSSGELGNGAGGSRKSPELIGRPEWTVVSAGASFTCGIYDGGELYCWGSDQWGTLGNGAGGNQTRPGQV